MQHSDETNRILKNLELAGYLSLPSATIKDDRDWFKIEWVDTDPDEKDRITIAFVDPNDGEEYRESYAALKEQGVKFYQYSPFDPESFDVKPLV